MSDLKIFFDVETSDAWNFKAANDDECQPRLVQLGAVVMDRPDHEVASISLIAKPEGWFISDETSGIHGITQEMAETYGLPSIVVLGVFSQLARLCQERIAFNIDFDDRVVAREIDLLNKPNCSKDLKPFCVMKAMSPICKIPKPEYQRRYNRNDPYKWPSLQEAYQFAFHQDFDGAHSAIADIRATAKLYWWLIMQPEQKEMLV